MNLISNMNVRISCLSAGYEYKSNIHVIFSQSDFLYGPGWVVSGQEHPFIWNSLYFIQMYLFNTAVNEKGIYIQHCHLDQHWYNWKAQTYLPFSAVSKHNYVYCQKLITLFLFFPPLFFFFLLSLSILWNMVFTMYCHVKFSSANF